MSFFTLFESDYFGQNSAIKSVTVLPTATEALRGEVYRLIDNSIGDDLYVCLRRSDGSFGWFSLTGESGGIPNHNVVSITSATYSATIDNDIINCNCTSNAITISMPTAVGNGGKQIVVRKSDSTTNNVVVEGNLSETINGALNISLTQQYTSVSLVSDGANWMVI